MELSERELFDEKIKGIYAAIEASVDIREVEYKHIIEKLNTIEANTFKTNGAIAKANLEIEHMRQNFTKEINILKVESLTHDTRCPVGPKVEKIQEELLEYKFLKKYPKIIFFAIVGLVIGTGLVFILDKLL